MAGIVGTPTKNEEALGLVKEIASQQAGEVKTALEQKWAEEKEANAKLFEQKDEEIKALKAQMDAMQDKKLTLNTKLGGPVSVRFKGYDPMLSKNFKTCIDEDMSEKIAAAVIKQINNQGMKFSKAFDGSNLVPEEFDNVIMGLAEYSSAALSEMFVFNTRRDIFNAPVKGTRPTVNSDAEGSANSEETPTVGKITWTISEHIGGYVNVLTADMDDSDIDFVNQWILPGLAESIGQYVDAEVFLGTNSKFTGNIIDITNNQVTFASAVDISTNNPCTYANMLAMWNGIDYGRVKGETVFFGNQAAYACILATVDSVGGRPMFYNDLVQKPVRQVLGHRFVFVPVIDNNAGTNGDLFIAYGDPKQYGIAMRGAARNMVNPYILMKEGQVQFISNIRVDGTLMDVANGDEADSVAFCNMVRSD